MSEENELVDEKNENTEKKCVTKAGLWEFVKSLCTLIIVGVCAYKFYDAKIEMTLDFPTLLSLLLAFFSVGLSALFYFKATETGNTFYDNTYKFTKDISQLLAKIESGFGERLRGIEDGYSKVQQCIYDGISPSNGDSQKDIEDKEEQYKEVKDKRDEIIEELLNKSKLDAEEKNNYRKILEKQEGRLIQKDREISSLKSRSKYADDFYRISQSITKDFINPSFVRSKSRFDRLRERLSYEYVQELMNLGYASSEGELTRQGYQFFAQINKELS